MKGNNSAQEDSSSYKLLERSAACNLQRNHHTQEKKKKHSKLSQQQRMLFLRRSIPLVRHHHHHLLQAGHRSFASGSHSFEFIHKPDFRPRRIILLRHGESLGNADESAYVTTADWRIPLTDLGIEQAVEAGKCLREKIEDGSKVVFYHSPYLRTKQTLEELLPHFSDSEILSCLEEPRICEQQIGNFQNVQQVLDAKKERSKFGRFFYRFPSGEAGLDVYNRVSSFIPTLVRDLDRHRRSGIDMDNVSVVIVTHGLALRLFLMRWFQWSVECFEESQNPGNCELVTMNKRKDDEGHAWMELEEKDRQSLCLSDACAVPRNVHLHRKKSVLHYPSTS